jgi:hypothetical protein
MNFPRYWARGKSGEFFCWRGSSQSQAEAQSLADAAARKIQEQFDRGDLARTSGHYYPDRPFREEILQETKNGAGELFAVVTRNSYGCRVLNTARVMFVDVDFPLPKRRGLFARLFGKADDGAANAEAESLALSRVESWTHVNPGWGWRIYRTRAGLRLMATHALVEPDALGTDRSFEALGADMLYRRLCKSQKCFRARLTPKPWRCGVRSKPARWPFKDDRAERSFREWEQRYQQLAGQWSTCALVKCIGSPAVHADIRPVIALHDEATRLESGLPLA